MREENLSNHVCNIKVRARKLRFLETVLLRMDGNDSRKLSKRKYARKPKMSKSLTRLSSYLLPGVMKRSDLSQIFRSERFPANLMSQYINLLSKFEVALPWSSEFLLVPSLLPDSQQDTNQPVAAGVSNAVAQAMNATAYTKGRVLRRQYVMSYVPSGFWPRLITR